ncbi:MAG TPA: UvrD-helicase domain-containing protein, partial [Thermoanaerobaculia bacterium]|nr:UvrD-helicase domain-containing protein [Thermoanaerobaculia bacterium]
DAPSLTGLNPEQSQAVLHGGGPILVLAGAGSGKTRVITHRLARLIETGVDPRTVVAVTFTNKAAREMRERVRRLLGGRGLASFVGTFHSWGLRFLRRHAAAARLDPRFAIADGADQLALVKEAMAEAEVSEQVLPAGAVRARISQAKNSLVTPEEFEASGDDYAGERIARVYKLYERRLAASRALDFDDLIVRPVRALRADAALLAAERRRVRHLLIDEYQDTNGSQDALVRLLGEGADSLCAVGDEDQAIYRWRGAEVEHILRFDADFPGARIVALERNYRSTAGILGAASALVAHNRRRRPKALLSQRGAGDRVRLWRFEEDRQEAEEVAQAIAESGRPFSEAAILYRTNAQSRAFEEQFLRRKVPYIVVGGMKFYERAEVKDALAYLRLAVHPEDDLAFRRVVNVPARGIGAATLDRIAAAARETGRSWWEVSAQAPPGLSDRARIALERFRALIEDLRARAESYTPSALLEHLLAATGYASLYDRSEEPEDVARRENLQELLSSAQEFERSNEEGTTIADYLDAVALATDMDTDTRSGAVTLSTLHAAKGLEFPSVYVVGLEEGYLPHGSSAEDPDELEEERRLLYVGMTRARDELTLTLADRRLVYGRVQYRSPSRFVEELPQGELEERGAFAHRSLRPTLFERRPARRPVDEENFEPEPEPETEGPLRRGRRVRHPRYGFGVILGQEGSGDDTRLTVYFDRAGKKKFVARYADLTPA